MGQMRVNSDLGRGDGRADSLEMIAERPARDFRRPELDFMRTFELYALDRTYKKTNDFQDKKDPNRRIIGDFFYDHFLSVARILSEAGSDYITISAGLVHDVLEDTPTRREDISRVLRGKLKGDFPRFRDIMEVRKHEDAFDQVMDITQLMTKKPDQHYIEYVESIYTAEEQQTRERTIEAKLADRTDNISSTDAVSRYGRSLGLRRRLYEAYKNLVILARTKIYIKNHEQRLLIERSPILKLYETLVEKTERQLRETNKRILQSPWSLIGFPVYICDWAALAVHEKFRGLSKSKRREETIFGMLFGRWAGITYDGTAHDYNRVLHPGVDPEDFDRKRWRLHRDCGLFLDVLLKLRFDDAYLPSPHSDYLTARRRADQIHSVT